MTSAAPSRFVPPKWGGTPQLREGEPSLARSHGRRGCRESGSLKGPRTKPQDGHERPPGDGPAGSCHGAQRVPHRERSCPQDLRSTRHVLSHVLPLRVRHLTRPVPRSTPGCRRSGQWSSSVDALLPSLHRARGGRDPAPRSRRRATRPFLRVGERRRPAPALPIRRSSHTASGVRTARGRERVRRAMTSGWAISRTREPRRTTGLDEENGACSARGHPHRPVVARRKSLSRGTPRPVQRGRRGTRRPCACRG